MTENERQVREIAKEYWRLMEERRADQDLPGERLARVETKLDHLIMVVEGNGEPGVLTRVRLLENAKAKVMGAIALIGLVVAVIEALHGLNAVR